MAERAGRPGGPLVTKRAALLFGGVPLLFLALFFLWPVIHLFWFGIFGGVGFDFQSTLSAVTYSRTRSVVFQTIAQAGSATFLSVLLGIPAAFVLYRLRFRGRNFLRAVVSIPFVLPTVVVAAAFISLYGPGGLLSFLGLDKTFLLLVLALTFFNVTVVARIVGSYWEDIDVRRIEAARVLGASPAKAFLTVTLRSLWRPIVSAAGLVFLFCASSFGVVFVLGGKKLANIETEIYRQAIQLFDLRMAATLAVIQTIIVIAAIIVTAKFREKPTAMVSDAAKAVRFNPREHLLAILVFVSTIVFLHTLPIVSLTASAFQDTGGKWTLSNFVRLFGLGAESTLASGARNAIFLSLFFAFFATVAAVLLGLSIAIFMTRKTHSKLMRSAQSLLEAVALLPLGISAVALGLGLLISMNRPLGLNIDLRASLVLIPIAQTLIALPLVLRTVLPRLSSISPRVLESASVLGASPLRVLFTIEVAQLRSTIAVASGFAFAASLGEFGAASFLVRGSDRTLPVLIAELINSPVPTDHKTGIAAAFLLAVITAGVMVLAESRTFKKGVFDDSRAWTRA